MLRGCCVHSCNIFTRAFSTTQTFIGHGEAINDISIHYKRPHLPITASRVWWDDKGVAPGCVCSLVVYAPSCRPPQDNSLRLWNLRTRVCILVLSGEGGHRNEVLSVVWEGVSEDRTTGKCKPTVTNTDCMCVRIAFFQQRKCGFSPPPQRRISTQQTYIKWFLQAWTIALKFGHLQVCGGAVAQHQ